MPTRLLYIGPPPAVLEPERARALGWELGEARDERALAALAGAPPELVLWRREQLGARGLAALEALEPRPALLALDAFGGAPLAYDGALETLALPAEAEAVVQAVRNALAARALRLENLALRRGAAPGFEMGALASLDERMRAAFEVARRVADTRVSVLLQGESGTGKSELARALHNASDRREQAFVEVNCGALPAGLLESELFGHARGAFTGAVSERPGKFEAADRGTLFLDEIGSASPELQVKLLRVIETGRLERVGETRTRTVDVRLVAAANTDLARDVAEKRFREDLYYRICVVTLELPPLRERRGDVPLLAARFLEHFRALHGRGPASIPAACAAALAAHAWPGNVRELRHAVERACLLAGAGPFEPEHFGPAVARAARALPAAATAAAPGDDAAVWPLKRALEIPERALIERALRHCGGNRERAAELLEINRATLFNKLRKYGIRRSA